MPMMDVLSHRGYWSAASEKNTLLAFERSFALGFGTETDVRDHDGRLVISHDMPGADALPYAAYLDCLARKATRPLLQAVNIKADGLATALAGAMKDVGHPWFVFDMSLPDTLGWRRHGMPYAVRLSEYEDGGPLLVAAAFVWLDAFERDDWYSIDFVRALLDDGKTVAVVSPELHGRPHAAAWQRLQPIAGHARLHLCTDLIAPAQEAFDVHPH